jgi:hypothetical protein
MQRERHTNTDVETLVLQRDGRLRVIKAPRFKSNQQRVIWLSEKDEIFRVLLGWGLSLDEITSLDGFEEYGAATDS